MDSLEVDMPEDEDEEYEVIVVPHSRWYDFLSLFLLIGFLVSVWYAFVWYIEI
jgi:hypothetical protein